MAGQGKGKPRVTYVKRALVVKYIEKGWEQCPVTRAWLYATPEEKGQTMDHLVEVMVFVPGAVDATATTIRRACYLTGGCPVHRLDDLETVG